MSNNGGIVPKDETNIMDIDLQLEELEAKKPMTAKSAKDIFYQ